jgi:hypothetical protein
MMHGTVRGLQDSDRTRSSVQCPVVLTTFCLSGHRISHHITTFKITQLFDTSNFFAVAVETPHNIDEDENNIVIHISSTTLLLPRLEPSNSSRSNFSTVNDGNNDTSDKFLQIDRIA